MEAFPAHAQFSEYSMGRLLERSYAEIDDVQLHIVQ